MFIFKFLIFLFLLMFGFFITPQHIFNGNFKFLGYMFILFFALLNYCIVKTIYRNYVYNKNNLGFKKGIFASIIGISALQVCGLSAYACSTTIGFTFLATFLPYAFLNFLHEFSVEILAISIFVQAFSILHLNCFEIKNLNFKRILKPRKSQ